MNFYKFKHSRYLAVFVLLSFMMSFSVALVVPEATALEGESSTGSDGYYDPGYVQGLEDNASPGPEYASAVWEYSWDTDGSVANPVIHVTYSDGSTSEDMYDPVNSYSYTDESGNTRYFWFFSVYHESSSPDQPVGTVQDVWTTYDVVNLSVPAPAPLPEEELNGSQPGQQQPGEEEGIPGDDEDTPGDDEDTPGDDEDTPGDDEDTPGDDESSPGDDEGTPGDDESAPGDEEGAPGDEEGAPGDEEGAPGDEQGAPGDEEGSPEGDDNQTVAQLFSVPASAGLGGGGGPGKGGANQSLGPIVSGDMLPLNQVQGGTGKTITVTKTWDAGDPLPVKFTCLYPGILGFGSWTKTQWIEPSFDSSTNSFTGTWVISGLDNGLYTITEWDNNWGNGYTPDGYLIDFQPIKVVTVDKKNPNRSVFYNNKHWSASPEFNKTITINKEWKDTNDNDKVETTYTVYSDSGGSFHPVRVVRIPKGSTSVTVDKLGPYSYKIVETVPTGFTVDHNDQIVNLTSAPNGSVFFENTKNPAPGTLIISKTCVGGDVSASFSISPAINGQSSATISDYNNHTGTATINNVPAGTYKITETSVYGYECTPSLEQTIIIEAGKPGYVSFTNTKEVDRKITIDKKDSDGNRMIADFKLIVGGVEEDVHTDGSKPWSKEYKIVSDAQCSIKEVANSNFYKATLNDQGNILENSDNFSAGTFTLPYDGKDVELDVINYQYGSIKVTKNCQVETSQPYADLEWTFTLKDSNSSVVGTDAIKDGETTDAFVKLPEGNYTLSESTVTGFSPDSNNQETFVIGPGSLTHETTWINVEHVGYLAIQKQVEDPLDPDASLSGFEFTVSNSTDTWNGISNESGVVLFDDNGDGTCDTSSLLLRAGSYTLTETNCQGYFSDYSNGLSVSVAPGSTSEEPQVVTVTNKKLADGTIHVVKHYENGNPVPIYFELYKYEQGLVGTSSIISTEGGSCDFTPGDGTYYLVEKFVNPDDETRWVTVIDPANVTLSENDPSAKVVWVTNTRKLSYIVSKDFTGNGWDNLDELVAVIDVSVLDSNSSSNSLVSRASSNISFDWRIALHDNESWENLALFTFGQYSVNEIGIYNESDVTINPDQTCVINPGAQPAYSSDQYTVTYNQTPSGQYGDGSATVRNHRSITNDPGGNPGDTGDTGDPGEPADPDEPVEEETIEENPAPPALQPQPQSVTQSQSAPQSSPQASPVTAEPSPTQGVPAGPAVPGELPSTGAEGLSSMLLLASMFAGSGFVLRKVGRK